MSGLRAGATDWHHKEMKTFSLFLSFVASTAFACPSEGPGLSKAEINKEKKYLQSIKPQKRKIAAVGMPMLPLNWGGPIVANWKAEAVLANAVSAALNEGWAQVGVKDVLVSAPVFMQYTGERVYGDGQTNAGLSFGTWNDKQPPLVATLLILKNGLRRVNFRFSPKVQITNPQMQVLSLAGNVPRKDQIILSSSANGFTGSWEVPSNVVFGDLQTPRTIWIRLEGSDSSFPLDFRQPVFSIPQLILAAGASKTVGQSPIDPLGIYQKTRQTNQLSKLVLMNSVFGPEWFRLEDGKVQIRNESIHGNIGPRLTAVGGGDTWFVPAGASSNFKNLYTCFDARNEARETMAGVPSGGGWHEIGNAAETIINNLENMPIPVGFASGMPMMAPPDGSKFAFDLTDVATVRMLLPGEGLMTPAGPTTWAEDSVFRQSKHGDWGPRGRGARAGRNYHWFIFPGIVPVCTQEWVHNCLPSVTNQLGLNCGDQN